MEQHDQDQPIKPGLPEALHPEIGNGASWEQNQHLLNLRSVDPCASFDDLLIDGNSRKAIISQWNVQIRPPEDAPEPEPEKPDHFIDPLEESPQSPLRLKGKEKKILASARDKSHKPDWFESLEETLHLKEDPNKPVDIEDTSETEIPAQPPKPEGKRVRKAAKKAKKEQKTRKSEGGTGQNEPSESTLSPFTKWLKGLRGSEYVHPYEDDYALGQMSATHKEGISETFADLLVAQGFTGQAIDMYKLLMAKYPEKSSFFAAKIEALK